MISTRQPRSCALELEAQPSRAGQVRRIVSAQLRYWNLDPVLDTALLGVTELLANVYRHAADKHCTVTLTLEEGLLTVAVADRDPRPAGPAAVVEALATSGRGLAMIAALCDAWGCRPDEAGAGKTVWFSLLPPATTTPHGSAALPAEPSLYQGTTAPAITLDDLAPPVAVSFA